MLPVAGAHDMVEAEVADFRQQLEGRLHAARGSRELALASFHHAQGDALVLRLPEVAAQRSRAAEEHRGRVADARARLRDQSEAKRQVEMGEWMETLPQEQAAAVQRIDDKMSRALRRIEDAFAKNCGHEGAALQQKLQNIWRDAATASELALDQASRRLQVQGPRSPVEGLALAAHRPAHCAMRGALARHMRMRPCPPLPHRLN